MRTKKKQELKKLSDWEWTTLVSAWRYLAFRTSIVSGTFPENLVSRFFGPGSEYCEDTKRSIALQFAMKDYYVQGEFAWAGMNDVDAIPWCKLYRFCEGYANGFKEVVVKHAGKTRTVKAFHVDRTGRWYSVEEYTRNPSVETWIAPDAIVEATK